VAHPVGDQTLGATVAACGLGPHIPFLVFDALAPRIVAGQQPFVVAEDPPTHIARRGEAMLADVGQGFPRMDRDRILGRDLHLHRWGAGVLGATGGQRPKDAQADQACGQVRQDPSPAGHAASSGV